MEILSSKTDPQLQRSEAHLYDYRLCNLKYSCSVLHENMKRLAKSVGPDHPALAIPKVGVLCSVCIDVLKRFKDENVTHRGVILNMSKWQDEKFAFV